MMKKLTAWLFAALLVPASLFGADKETIPVARLVYFEDPAGDMIFRGRDGSVIEFDNGTTFGPGTKIFTGSGFAELQLEPNGSILKLSSGTTFELTSLQGRSGSDTNIFTLYAGKLRTVAARVFGRQDRYTIRTSTAVCGIRGTDIVNDLTPGAAAVFCQHGVVEVTSPAGKREVITDGQKVNTTGGIFKKSDMNAGEIATVFNGMNFVRLDPRQVAGNGLPPGEGPGPVDSDTIADARTSTGNDTAEAGDAAATDTTVSEAGDGDDTGSDASTGSRARQTGAPADTLLDGSGDEGSAGSRDTGTGLPFWLTDLLGFEIGTISVDNDTWSQVVLQPEFDFDRLKFGLYLPVIYTDNLFDPGQWYHPDGNNEWSFGSDQDGQLWDILVDINRDLWLKIRYVEIGDNLVDPFYLKLGNLSTMTLGHGALVRDYANDADFPGIRRVGLNVGLRMGPVGLEYLGDDMSELQLTGGRFSFSPISAAKDFRIGLSAVVDMRVAENAADPGAFGDPMLMAMALDMEFFKVDAGAFRMVGYADVGAVMPYFRVDPEDATWADVGAGAAFDALYRDGQLRNFGVNAGVQGRVSLFRFILELRYENGLYRVGLFNNTWERMKQEYLTTVLDDLQDDSDPTNTIGVYGSGGLSLFNDRLSFDVSYYWPWLMQDGTIEMSDTDYFKAQIVLERGLIPVLNAYGSVSYERQKFAGMFHDDELLFLDGNAVLKGELVIPLTPVVDMAFVVSTATDLDSAGNVVFHSDGVTPKISPVFNLETRLHF